MATTSAAVTGMKNSAPDRSANGKRDDQPDAGEQRQRSQQPVALGGDAFREHAGFVGDVLSTCACLRVWRP